ncbi:MAG: hypothetical protein ACK419_01685 [Pyrinomonadaceae bacterium]
MTNGISSPGFVFFVSEVCDLTNVCVRLKIKTKNKRAFFTDLTPLLLNPILRKFYNGNEEKMKQDLSNQKEKRDALTHGARMAMNHNPEIRAWVENYLKNKVREEKAEMSDEEFEVFWKYHKPEIMHERAVEGFSAYKASRK